MSIYDQTNQNGVGTPWYAPQQTSATPRYQQPTQQGINQFVWVNGPGTVDMWPVAAGSEMTFIDNENMLLYVKRVDEFGHPFRVRKFKMTEIKDENEVARASDTSIDMEELKTFLTKEIDKVVNAKLKDMFTIRTEGSVIDA